MADFPYTLKQIAEITGKSNTALFGFINENKPFINEHSQKSGKNGRFIKYDEEALQAFIKRFGKKVSTLEEFVKAQTSPEIPKEGAETPSNPPEGAQEDKPQASVIEAFEAQIEALKRERDELTAKLDARERDCAEWRTQAGQALSALSKEQERVERLEERLAGYLPAPNAQTEVDKQVDKADEPKPTKRKLTFRERIGVLFGHELEVK